MIPLNKVLKKRRAQSTLTTAILFDGVPKLNGGYINDLKKIDHYNFGWISLLPARFVIISGPGNG